MAYDAVNDPIKAARLVCEKFLFHSHSVQDQYPGAWQHMDMRVREAHDQCNRLLFLMTTWMLDGHKVVRRENTKISFPASPWDFFKQEHFPAWALRWWPVKLNETEVPFHDHHHHICPHLVTDDRKQHIMFMYEGVNGKADNDSRIASDAGK